MSWDYDPAEERSKRHDSELDRHERELEKDRYAPAPLPARTEPIDSMEQLPEAECKYGYPWSQLARVMDPQQLRRLGLWMRGQTMTLCDGRAYNHEKKEYYDTGCGPHGGVVYSHDLANFLRAGPILD